MALNAKQKMFCEEYVANGYNATKAYMATHPDAKDGRNSHRMLKNQEVRDYIYEIQKDRFEALNVCAERVAEKLAEIAFAPKGDVDYNATAQLKALDLLQKQLGLQQQKMEVGGQQNIKINIGGEA